MPKATASTTATATSSWDSMQKFYDMVGDTADHLRNNFQYGETVRGHMVENQELRKLFKKLNNLTAQIDRARTVPDFSGTGPDMLALVEALAIVLAKFEHKLELMGMDVDAPGTLVRLRAVRSGLDDLTWALTTLRLA